jgi:hypothetical protein
MRRWLMILTSGLAAAAALSLSACGTAAPPATWVKATFVAPKVGDCYNHRPTEQWSRLTDLPQACSSSHYYETAYVGNFAGAKASATLPPKASADEYSQCQVESGKYLGGDVHDARVTLHVTMPSDRDWELGARWFRCDLTTFTDFDSRPDATSNTEALKDGMVGDKPARMQCINTPDADNDTITSMPLVKCSESHNAEFVGYSLAAEGDYPADEALNKLGDSCLDLIDGYIGAIRKEGFLGWIWYIPTRGEWRLGDRTVSCFVVGIDGHHWTGSIEGLGSKPFPKS